QSSENFEESPQPQKPSSPGEFQDKEAPTPKISSITCGQMPEHRTPLFSELHLAKLERMFAENIDSNGVLDLGVFIKTMKKVLQNVSDEMLETLFLKVDSNCNGFITWEKYMDYMMREFQGLELMRKSQYRLLFQLPMRIIPLNHGCEIVKVEFFIQRFKKIGCFLTITKDGILQFWSESFSLINSFMLSQFLQLHSQQMWVTDMVCLPNLNLIAVSSTELKIEFFDISDHKCVRTFTFIDLDCCVLAMNYWSDYHRGVFCYGDTKGNVIVFISDSVTTGLFNPHILPRLSKWDHWIKVSMPKLLTEKSAVYRSYQLRALHPNWCQKVKFISDLNLVVSCSAVEKSSLVLTVLPAKDLEKPRFTVLSLRKGVLCFDYCSDRNFLATGGYDSHIYLWNPLFSKKPVWVMKGHQTSVMHLLVNSKNSSILISISRDKNIRVWDMQDYICLQSFCGKLFALGNCPITSACFHETDNTLICSTYSIGILNGYLECQQPMKTGKLSTHSAAVCNVLYSKIFKQVVSGCLHGTVCVWELFTGTKMVDFSVSGTHFVELTSMALDESERCLLTGLRDGTMKMWNYNSGECLLTFPNPDKVEISGLVHMNKAYYMTGWSKRITNFMFHKTKPVLLCYHWQTFHTEDVLSMAKYQHQFLGTSSYNGDILFWNVNTMKPVLRFNASFSPLPLKPKKVLTEGCLAERHSNKPCMKQKKWVHKVPQKSSRVTTNANLRRNLVSAPPVMSHSFSPSLPRHQRSYIPVPYKVGEALDRSGLARDTFTKQSMYKEAQRKKGELQKKLLLQQSRASVEKIIFLQTRPRQPHTAAMLSSCIDGHIYAWSIHGNGGLLGKFPVDLKDNGDVVVGAMATDENDWILITGDCKGHIKIWDIKDYCILIHQQPLHTSGSKIPIETENKFRILIPKRFQMNIPHYIPLKETEVVAGQIISLVPPKLLNTWRGHLESIVDILYIDTFQLVISAGQDRDVKAWKLSGDAIGTFGLNVWKRLQDAKMDGIHEQRESVEEKSDSIGTLLKASHQELHRDLAEALVYQRREQEALMLLLSGRADTEAEAWAKLHRMAPMSPWAGEHSLQDIEASWSEWESKGKQVSKVVGAAFKPKERLQNPKVLFSGMQNTWMRRQISPQIYQNLFFNELTPVQPPDSLIHRVLDQQGRHIRWVAHDLEPPRDQVFVDTTPIATSSHSSSLSPAASTFRLLDSSSSLRPRSSTSWPRSASMTSPSALPEGSQSTLQRPEITMAVASSLLRPPKPLEAPVMSSPRRSFHVRF
uniref:WD repeat-containing protein on Y chromosome n=1 Tax=Marmota marmota marmota TaxID=9994 RepID=A0A8C6AE10_MARMA